MKIYLTNFEGDIAEVEATDTGKCFVVDSGEHEGIYHKFREGNDFFAFKERAEMDSIDKLRRKIARLTHDKKSAAEIDPLKARLKQLEDGLA